MKNKYVNLTLVGLAIVAMAGLAVVAVPNAQAACGPRGAACAKSPAKAPAKCCQTSAGCPKGAAKLTSILAAARKAADAGDAKAAAIEIAKAQQLLTGMQKRMPALKPAAGPVGKAGKIVNTRCPIMGNKVNVERIPANLTREFKGKKVGFCCGGCPAAWDKLPDAVKTTKLKAAL